MDYDLDLPKAAETIRKECAKVVVVQVPDGLKPKAQEIVDYLCENTGAKIIIWAGSCFGACDTPLGLEKLGVDLLIQWGHSPWKYVFGNPHEQPLAINIPKENFVASPPTSELKRLPRQPRFWSPCLVSKIAGERRGDATNGVAKQKHKLQ